MTALTVAQVILTSPAFWLTVAAALAGRRLSDRLPGLWLWLGLRGKGVES